MTASIAAISRARHGGLRIGGGIDIAAAAVLGHVAIGLDEIPLAGCDYPIVLLKDAASGGFRLVVLLGFDSGSNLFMMNGNWLATYLPLNILRLPFCLGAPGGGEAVACLDEASPLVNHAGGTLLFDADGAETEFLAGRRAMLDRMQADADAAAQFIAAIVAARLATPLTLSLHFDDRRRQDIEGAYTIDPLALEALPGDSLVALHRRGHLAAAYGLVHSLGQINRLEQLHNARGGSRIVQSAAQIHI